MAKPATVTVEMPSKPAWQSRTLWLNVLSIIALVLTDQAVLAIMPREWLPYAVAALAIANIALRSFTNQPLTRSITSKSVTNEYDKADNE